MIGPLDPRKWPGLIVLIVERTYAEVDSWEFLPYTDAEIREQNLKGGTRHASQKEGLKEEVAAEVRETHAEA